MLLIIGKFVWNVFWCEYNETQNMDITKKLIILQINIFILILQINLKFYFSFLEARYLSLFLCMLGEI